MPQMLGDVLRAFRPGQMPPVLAWVVSVIGVPILLIALVNALTEPAPAGPPTVEAGAGETAGPDAAGGAATPSPGIIDNLPSAGDPRTGIFSAGDPRTGIFNPTAGGGATSATARQTCSSTLCNVTFYGLLFGSAAGVVVVAFLKKRRLKVWLPLSAVALVLGIGQPFITPVTVLAALALSARPDLNSMDPDEAQLVAEEEETARRAYEVDSAKRAGTAREGQFRVMTWLSRVTSEIDAAAARHEWSKIHTGLVPLAEIKVELNRMYIPLTDASKASWRRALESIGAYEKAVRRGVTLGVQIEYHPPPEQDGFFARGAQRKIAKRDARVAEEIRKAGNILEDSTLYIGYSREELLGPNGPAPEMAVAPLEAAAAPAAAASAQAEPAVGDAAGLPVESLREQSTLPPPPRANWRRPERGHRRRRF